MNYQKHYDNLMKSRKEACSFGNLEYWEVHHIVPKCIGGTNDEDNLVWLTAREHYIAHWLLTKIHKHRAVKYAFTSMSMHERRRLTSKQIERARVYKNGIKRSDEIKRKLSEAAKKQMTPEFRKYLSDINKGKVLSEETRKKISEGGKRRYQSEEEREKARIRGTGRKHSEETLEKLKGRNVSEETRKKIGEIHKGMKHTEKSKQKMRESWKKRKENNVLR